MKRVVEKFVCLLLVTYASIAWGVDLDGVYYCTDDASVGIYDGEKKTLAPGRFTMKIEDGRVVTVKEPNFVYEGVERPGDEYILQIIESPYELPNFTAKSLARNLVMYGGRYTQSRQVMGLAELFAGSCEKF